MKVFCPNCGTENQGQPGSAVVCSTCTASFDVPNDRTVTTATVDARPKEATPIATGVPQKFRPAAPAGVSTSTNTLAIVSLVTSFFCCAPVGLVAGIVAIGQINKTNGLQKGKEIAIIGIVLNGLLLASWVLYGVALAIGN